jgi:hypothetical protein
MKTKAHCTEFDSIIVEFSGWCKISADSIHMQHAMTGETITGDQYFALSESERGDYLLEDLIATLRDCDDNEWIDIDFFKEEE